MRLSPRLGLSFPVTERDKFFFNYGHFSQWPRFAYVYPQLEAQTATEIQLLGNPNLDPKVTVEYETGHAARIRRAVEPGRDLLQPGHLRLRQEREPGSGGHRRRRDARSQRLRAQ